MIPVALTGLFGLFLVGAAVSQSSVAETTATPPEASTTTAATETTTTTETAPIETTSTTTTVAEFEIVSFECAGETVEMPMAEDDTPEAVCEQLKTLLWMDKIRTELPLMAEISNANDSWDDLEGAGRVLCTPAEASLTATGLAESLLLGWEGMSPGLQSDFNNDVDEFLKFAGISIRAFCPDAVPSE